MWLRVAGLQSRRANPHLEVQRVAGPGNQAGTWPSALSLRPPPGLLSKGLGLLSAALMQEKGHELSQQEKLKLDSGRTSQPSVATAAALSHPGRCTGLCTQGTHRHGQFNIETCPEMNS